eukprot:725991_1
MTTFNSKLAFFETAFKKETKSSTTTKPIKKQFKLVSEWETKRPTHNTNCSTIPIQIITTNDDEKIDEYSIWTQYMDAHKTKPSSAFQLSAFTKTINTIPSINMSIAKTIFTKYKNTNYKPISKPNDIPTKKLYNPIQAQSPPPPIKVPKKKLYNPIKPKTKSPTPFNGLAKKQFLSGTCQICLEKKDDILTTNKCHHKLCKTCMRRYIKLAPNKMQIKCPEFKCASLLSQYYDIKCVLTNTEYAEMYLKKLINNLSYVSGEVICLTETCFNRMTEADVIDGKFLQCNDCNQCWCVDCNFPWHEGLSCDESYYNRRSQMSDILLNCG